MNWVLTIEYYKKAITYFDEPDILFVVTSDNLDKSKKIIKELNIDNVIYLDEVDYIKLFIMSKLDGYILSNSTYNAWAWFLNEKAYDIPVIAPII